MLACELRDDAFDRTPRAEWLTAIDAVKRRLLLEHDGIGPASREIEPWCQADDFLGAGGLAQSTLDARVFLEAQLRHVRIVDQRARRAGADAGETQSAAVDSDFDGAKRCARRQRQDVAGF